MHSQRPQDSSSGSDVGRGGSVLAATRMRSAVMAAALLVLAEVAACGWVPVGQNPGDVVASGVRSPSPSPQVSAPPNLFAQMGCTGEASGAPTNPALDTFQTVISVPPGWTSLDMSGQDADFKLVAPASYQHSPTTILISAPLPTNQGDSAISYLTRTTAGIEIATAPIQACKVGADEAAFLPFTSGSTVGYFVLWLHFGDAYELLLRGNGGVDARAVQDARLARGNEGPQCCLRA